MKPRKAIASLSWRDCPWWSSDWVQCQAAYLTVLFLRQIWSQQWAWYWCAEQGQVRLLCMSLHLPSRACCCGKGNWDTIPRKWLSSWVKKGHLCSPVSQTKTLEQQGAAQFRGCPLQITCWGIQATLVANIFCVAAVNNPVHRVTAETIWKWQMQSLGIPWERERLIITVKRCTEIVFYTNLFIIVLLMLYPIANTILALHCVSALLHSCVQEHSLCDYRWWDWHISPKQ